MSDGTYERNYFEKYFKAHVKPSIAQLYESEASHLLEEEQAHLQKGHIPAAILNLEKIEEFKTWCVYIVECSDGTLYTGISNNVSKRLLTHNSGKGAKYTKTRLPVVLKYVTESNNRSEASKLEYKIKKLSRSKKIELINEIKRD